VLQLLDIAGRHGYESTNVIDNCTKRGRSLRTAPRYQHQRWAYTSTREYGSGCDHIEVANMHFSREERDTEQERASWWWLEGKKINRDYPNRD